MVVDAVDDGVKVRRDPAGDREGRAIVGGGPAAADVATTSATNDVTAAVSQDGMLPFDNQRCALR